MKRVSIILLVVGVSAFSLFFSCVNGSTETPINPALWLHHSEFRDILLQLRLPRTLTAFVSGALLALAGALMQLLLQNPLADPYILGISGGSALMTLLLMALGMEEAHLMGAAFVGSLISILFILLLARKHRWQTHTLLLCGIALACGFSACISFILLLSPDAHLRSMLFWLSGDLSDATYPWLGLLILCCGALSCHLLAPGLNLLGRGEKEARALGLSPSPYRLMLYLLSALLTATAVTLAGCIGFVGLIVPHLSRRLVGYDHRLMLPVTLFLGGSLLTLTDTCARTLFAPLQLPVGIVLALIGVPVFVWMIQK